LDCGDSSPLCYRRESAGESPLYPSFECGDESPHAKKTFSDDADITRALFNVLGSRDEDS
jgi:hypothetical protein